MKLTGYFRSSAAWRVRIALAWKGLDYTADYVHLTRDGGEQHGAAYRARNPAGLVPFFEDEDLALGQSLAILEYLEETRPQPPLLPSEPGERAKVREIAQAIACDIHPLNNLRVLQYLTGPLGQDEATKLSWYRHWIEVGFDGLEPLLPEDAETRGYCRGSEVTLADVCLVPQVYNARRFECPMAAYPRISAIADRLMALPAFAETAPDRQPDAG